MCTKLFSYFSNWSSNCWPSYFSDSKNTPPASETTTKAEPRRDSPPTDLMIMVDRKELVLGEEESVNGQNGNARNPAQEPEISTNSCSYSAAADGDDRRPTLMIDCEPSKLGSVIRTGGSVSVSASVVPTPKSPGSVEELKRRQQAYEEAQQAAQAIPKPTPIPATGRSADTPVSITISASMNPHNNLRIISRMRTAEKNLKKYLQEHPDLKNALSDQDPTRRMSSK